jgi:hypothetical protein
MNVRWLWFPVAVVATAVVLVVGAAVAAITTFPVRAALAGSLAAGRPMAGAPFQAAWPGHPGGPGAGFALPSELQGLAQIPPGQRFAHFEGAQVSLKDQNGQPLIVDLTPGTVSAASPTSLTLAANDGTTRTFTVSAATMTHRASAPTGTSTSSPPDAFQPGDTVVVVSLNHRNAATAVLGGGPWGSSSASGRPGSAGVGGHS